MSKDLHTITFTFFESGEPFTQSHILKTEDDPDTMSREILYNFFYPNPDDLYSPDDCEIKVNTFEDVKHLTPIRKKKIEDDLFEVATLDILEYLNLPEESHKEDFKDINEWLHKTIEDFDDLHSTTSMSVEYERYKIQQIPVEDLPLYLNTFKTGEANIALATILKGEGREKEI